MSETAEPSPDQPLPPAGIVRRLLAIVYDVVLLGAVLYCAMGILLLVTAGAANHPGSPLVRAFLLAVTFLFYGWFWMRDGQTLGLRSWRLRIVSADGRPLTWGVVMLRFTLALVGWAAFGLGFLWMILDPDRQTLYDRIAGTRVVLLPKKPRPADE